MKRSTFIGSLLALVATPVLAIHKKGPPEWARKYGYIKSEPMPWVIRESVMFVPEDCHDDVAGYSKDLLEGQARARIDFAVQEMVRTWETETVFRGKKAIVMNFEVILLPSEKDSELLRRAINQ